MTGPHGWVSPSEMTQPLLIFEEGLQPGWHWPARDTDPTPSPIAEPENATETTAEFPRPNVSVSMMNKILAKLRELP